MRLFAGNLPWSVDDDELRNIFSAYGDVTDSKVIMDRETGRSRGFGFVEMPDNSEAESAIKAMSGKDFNGRALTVNEARPREDSPRRDNDRGDAPRW